MNTKNVRVERSGNETSLRATLEADDAQVDGFELACSWTDLDPNLEPRVGDALLAFLLLPAMACGETLDLASHTVSAKLLDQLDRLQDLYLEWSHGLSRIHIEATPEVRKQQSDGTALFFSGGVDSWYSALTCEEEGFLPSHLLFLVGFDISTDLVRRLSRAQEVAQRAAGDLGAKLVVNRTNLRRLTRGLLDWNLYHGGYMTGVALAMGGELTRCMIPASLSPDSVNTTWGSHPDLDPMWGTESLEFAHSGFQTNRIDKIMRIAEDEFAFSTLRVCWHPVDEYNCGRCAKCSLAMAVLRVFDKLEEADSFPNELDLGAIAANDAHFPQSERRTVILNLLPLAEARGDVELVRALKKSFRSKYLRPYKYMRYARRAMAGDRRPRAVLNRMMPYDK